MKSAFEGCRAYLDKLPPAVSGAGGHAATFKAAAWCSRFALGDGEAMTLLRDYSRRCSPPWTERELLHKLADARRVAGGSVRCLAPAKAVRFTYRLAPRKTAAPVKVEQPPPAETPALALAPVAEVQLPPDQAAWLPVARQVLAGEFHGADRSMRESLVIGLRSVPHPVCREALKRLSQS